MPAILPDHVAASFQLGSWQVPHIFNLIQHTGSIAQEEMYSVFNMGLGMVAVCSEHDVAPFQNLIPDAVSVGRIVTRDGDAQVVFAGS